MVKVHKEKIKNNDNDWENDIPENVSKLIKKKKLFREDREIRSQFPLL